MDEIIAIENGGEKKSKKVEEENIEFNNLDEKDKKLFNDQD
jgi:hypothetical protein